MLSEQLQQKLLFWEKFYFGLDEPVPFKGELLVYPVLTKDYYKFYSYFPCLTMDKNIKTVMDEEGKLKKVSNPQGISMSYLSYLISVMEDEKIGPNVTSQVISLLELVLHIENGFFCPVCGEEIKYKEIQEQLRQIEIDCIREGKDEEYIQNARREYFIKLLKCPKCNSNRREIISIKNQSSQNSQNGNEVDNKKPKIKILTIYNTDINSKDFDEFKTLVAHQNIFDYNADKYIDPELKEELDIKARLQNQDYTSPSLEKQLVCICAGSGYTLKQLKEEVTIRKLSLLLKVIDAKASYYAQVQGSYSGMVKFKTEPKHWIFSENTRSIADEFTSLDSFRDKFKMVT